MTICSKCGKWPLTSDLKCSGCYLDPSDCICRIPRRYNISVTGTLEMTDVTKVPLESVKK